MFIPFKTPLTTKKVDKKIMSPLWVSFVLKVIFIASTILSVLSLMSTIIGCLFGGKWKRQALVAAITTVLTTTIYLYAQPILFTHEHWDFSKGLVGAVLVLIAGKIAIPPWTAAICLVFQEPSCGPVAGSILASIDVAVAGAIIWNTEGYV